MFINIIHKNNYFKVTKNYQNINVNTALINVEYGKFKATTVITFLYFKPYYYRLLIVNNLVIMCPMLFIIIRIIIIRKVCMHA